MEEIVSVKRDMGACFTYVRDSKGLQPLFAQLEVYIYIYTIYYDASRLLDKKLKDLKF